MLRRRILGHILFVIDVLPGMQYEPPLRIVDRNRMVMVGIDKYIQSRFVMRSR